MAKIQVDKAHYEFSKYITKRRWISIWHQISILSDLAAKNVLELGPGAGVLKNIASLHGIEVKTVDIDESLSPDFVGDLRELKFDENSFDVTCAFQVLEHIPFDEAMDTLRELKRISKIATVISLPNCKTRYPVSVRIPKFGEHCWTYPNLIKHFLPKNHEFDGQHYWEIGAKQYGLEAVIEKIEASTNARIVKDFRLPEFPYHHFFILKSE